MNIYDLIGEKESITVICERNKFDIKTPKLYCELNSLLIDNLSELFDYNKVSYIKDKDELWYRLIRAFVPKVGKADTLFGEMLRAISYLENYELTDGEGAPISLDPKYNSSRYNNSWIYIFEMMMNHSYTLRNLLDFSNWSNEVASKYYKLDKNQPNCIYELCFKDRKLLLDAIKDSMISIVDNPVFRFIKDHSKARESIMISRFFEIVDDLNQNSEYSSR